jgi:UV DNA damage repair endonuclease
VYEYYDINDDELGVIKESWDRMGINPTTHLSNAKSKDGSWKDYFSHSDYLYDTDFNKKVVDVSMRNNFDIECEAKAKLPAIENFHKDYFVI